MIDYDEIEKRLKKILEEGFSHIEFHFIGAMASGVSSRPKTESPGVSSRPKTNQFSAMDQYGSPIPPQVSREMEE